MEEIMCFFFISDRVSGSHFDRRFAGVDPVGESAPVPLRADVRTDSNEHPETLTLGYLQEVKQGCHGEKKRGAP